MLRVGGDNGRVKSWLEVSGERLRGNVAAIRAVAGAEAEVLAVIKADAYGHGAELVAPVLVAAGVRWLGVGDLDEGARVRQVLAAAGLGSEQTGGDTRILVMCGMEPEDAPRIVEHRLTPVVWTVDHIEAVERAAESAGRRVRVHLEIDSGMARQGAAPGEELARVVARLRGSAWVRCEGVFSHLSASETRELRGAAGEGVTSRQLERFAEALAQLPEGEVLPEWVHLANSSAVDEGSTERWVREKAAAMSAGVLVRTGLAVYGYCLPVCVAGEEAEADGSLRGRVRPVGTWKTRVIGLREIAAGETVGYGATFVASEPMRLALLSVGYADGFRREASSGIGDGWVVIAGQRARVVGRVSMNLTVVDVTGIAGVAVGDEVVLLGEGVSAEDHARWCGTIPYEILCGMRAEKKLGS